MRDTLSWHHSRVAPPDSARLAESLPQSLARAAARWPDRPAVVWGEHTCSFRELAGRAAALGADIREAATAPGPVALVQSVGVDAIAAWFACALAGRPLLLLEPDHPPARLHALIDAAGCALVLVDQRTSGALAEAPQGTLLIRGDRYGSLFPDLGLGAQEPAMIFPTSGSTGMPKLVTYAAATLQAKVQSSMHLMRVPDGARVLIAGSHGNYGFLHHACVFLFAGGTLCLVDVKTGGLPSVREAILTLGARHVRFTPSMFRTLAAWPQAHDALRCLDAVRFSGEPLLTSDLALAQAVLRPECLIQNVYGSTESALFLWSHGDDLTAADGPTVPIGRIYPLASYAIKPLDDGDADDTTGELLIRSAVHALGDFTAGAIDGERFQRCADDPAQRIYATGDMVRRLPDGCLMHLGRVGGMVKIRGNRVFLAEIENHVRAMPGITGAAVVERPEKDGSVLYAFITSEAGTGSEAGTELAVRARAWLAARLPDFMQPRGIVLLPELPVLPGGKADHAALRAQIPLAFTATGVREVRSDAFGRLIALWDAVLWAGAHAHDADFPSLGGDSLALMTLSAEVERVFGTALPMDQFLADSTLGHLARLIGIDGDRAPMARHEGLRVRRVWPGHQPSMGVALAVPGWRGQALAVPFGRAGLFPNHDLWAADFSIPSGTMGDARRWWQAAQEIVDSIRRGAIPAPHVIFGYSFGGGLAWLVSRLLAGTPHCPQCVVMVDAVPLHWLRAFHEPEMTHALARVSHTTPPPVLHIRRSPVALATLGLSDGSTGVWKPEDGIRMLVDLPTVEHLELMRQDMLALAVEPVTAFLAGQYDAVPRPSNVPPPDLYGVRIHDIVCGKPGAWPHLRRASAMGDALRIKRGHFLPLLQVTCATGTEDEVRALLHVLRDSPTSRLAQYTGRRLRRQAAMWCPDDLPRGAPPLVAAVERALAQRPHTPTERVARPLRLCGLMFDLGQAIVAAWWARWSGHRRAA